MSVAIFELGGYPIEYEVGGLDWGAEPVAPPFQSGEEIVISGKMVRNESFAAYAVYMPDKELLIGRNPYLELFSGIAVLLMSLVGAALFLKKYCNFQPSIHCPNGVLAPFFVMSFVAFVGFSIFNLGIQYISAKKMIRVTQGVVK